MVLQTRAEPDAMNSDSAQYFLNPFPVAEEPRRKWFRPDDADVCSASCSSDFRPKMEDVLLESKPSGNVDLICFGGPGQFWSYSRAQAFVPQGHGAGSALHAFVENLKACAGHAFKASSLCRASSQEGDADAAADLTGAAAPPSCRRLQKITPFCTPTPDLLTPVLHFYLLTIRGCRRRSTPLHTWSFILTLKWVSRTGFNSSIRRTSFMSKTRYSVSERVKKTPAAAMFPAFGPEDSSSDPVSCETNVFPECFSKCNKTDEKHPKEQNKVWILR